MVARHRKEAEKPAANERPAEATSEDPELPVEEPETVYPVLPYAVP